MAIYKERAPLTENYLYKLNKNLLGHIVYVLGMVLFAVSLPQTLWNEESKNFILIIGYIALWRYSFWALNVTRFLIYEKKVFPNGFFHFLIPWRCE